MKSSQLERQVDDWGRVLFQGEDALELLFRGGDITKAGLPITPEIDAFNQHCIEHDKLEHVIHPTTDVPVSPEEMTARRQATWFMPEQYLTLDIEETLYGLCQTDEERERVEMELTLFADRGMLPILRLMCYLVDSWRKNGVVWGVGRGSSVASYCLYLLGVHKIDSIRYHLDIQEFLK